MSYGKKIMIAYATAGIGHKKAALAIEDALKTKHPNVKVKMIDVLNYANSFFKQGYPSVYLFMINKALFIWGLLYYGLDNKFTHFILKKIRAFIHVINFRRLVKLLRDYKPDVVISTHFLMPDVCYYVKRKYGINPHVVNVVTDYRAHSFWISDGVDEYFVACDKTREDLVEKWGIKKKNVTVTGIPVELKFARAHDKIELRKKFSLDSDRFTILLLSGGYGVGPVYEMIETLNASFDNISIIVVCGHNKDLHKKINEFKKKARIGILNLGYVDNVDELMGASDLYIGKAGGISVTEALSMKLPVVFIRPIPGQESRNADLLISLKAGKLVVSVQDVAGLVKELASSGKKLDALIKGVSKLRKPEAAVIVADKCVYLHTR